MLTVNSREGAVVLMNIDEFSIREEKLELNIRVLF